MLKRFIKDHRSNPIIGSSLTIGAITVLVKVLGYLEKILLAYYWGTSYIVDVYSVVTGIILSIFVFFRETTEPGFLNLFLKERHLQATSGTWSVFNFFFQLLIGASILLTIFAWLTPGTITNLFAPGFSAEKKILTITLIQLVFPSCIFLAGSVLFNIALNGLKQFSLAAFGELAYKASILIVLILFIKHWGIYAAALAILMSAFIKFLIQGWQFFKHVSFKKQSLDPVTLKIIGKLTWPLLVGVSFSQLASLADNIFASYLPVGSIAALSYARKLVDFPLLVCPYILSIVIFPYFTELAIARETEKRKELLHRSLLLLLLIFLPLSIYFYTCSYEMTSLIFKHGAFNDYSTLLTALPLRYYAMGMVFFAVEMILVVYYFANADTRTPIVIGVLCVCENIILAFVLIKVMGYAGIALAYTIAKATKTLILLVLLRNDLRLKAVKSLIYLLKITVSGIALAGGILSWRFLFYQNIGNIAFGNLLFLVTAFVLGLVVYLGVLALLRAKPSVFSLKF